MEVAQMYIDKYHFAMDKLNVQRPSIEPRIGTYHRTNRNDRKIIEKGYAYITNGSFISMSLNLIKTSVTINYPDAYWMSLSPTLVSWTVNPKNAILPICSLEKTAPNTLCNGFAMVMDFPAGILNAPL